MDEELLPDKKKVENVYKRFRFNTVFIPIEAPFRTEASHTLLKEIN